MNKLAKIILFSMIVKVKQTVLENKFAYLTQLNPNITNVAYLIGLLSSLYGIFSHITFNQIKIPSNVSPSCITGVQYIHSIVNF